MRPRKLLLGKLRHPGTLCRRFHSFCCPKPIERRFRPPLRLRRSFQSMCHCRYPCRNKAASRRRAHSRHNCVDRWLLQSKCPRSLLPQEHSSLRRLRFRSTHWHRMTLRTLHNSLDASTSQRRCLRNFRCWQSIQLPGGCVRSLRRHPGQRCRPRGKKRVRAP